MPKSDHQKLKLLRIKEFLEQKTDENHPATMEDIIQYLLSCEIKAERKSVYDDINALIEYGCPIEKKKDGKRYIYYLKHREFTITELQTLANAVASAKFLPERKATDMIRKIMGLTNEHRAKLLKKRVFVKGRARSVNEEALKNVNRLQGAMQNNRCVSFSYCHWNEKKELEKSSEKNNISPWHMVWDNENYYLVAYDPMAKASRHYRVDRMKDLKVSEQPRTGEEFCKVQEAFYSNQYFNMFDGPLETITFRCNERGLEILIDRFGTDITVFREKEHTYTVHAKVCVSKVFLGWVMGLGEAVTILRPDSVVDKLSELCGAHLHSLPERRIKNLVFDIGNVLVDFRYMDYMRERGFTEEERRFFGEHIVLSEIWLKLDSGEMTQQEVVDFWKKTYPEMEERITEFFRDTTELVRPYEDTREWLQYYKKKGYGIYLLTNYPDELFDEHQERSFQFMDLVDGYVVSAKVKETKPNPPIYEELFKAYGLNPRECVFIDDREENVLGAEAVKMHGICAKNRADAKRDLEHFLTVNGCYHERR